MRLENLRRRTLSRDDKILGNDGPFSFPMRIFEKVLDFFSQNKMFDSYRATWTIMMGVFLSKFGFYVDEDIKKPIEWAGVFLIYGGSVILVGVGVKCLFRGDKVH